MATWIASRDKKRLREAIRNRDGDACCYCGEKMDWTIFRPGQKPTDSSVTLEHIVQRSDGGTNRLHNLKLAHRRCNMEAQLWYNPIRASR